MGIVSFKILKEYKLIIEKCVGTFLIEEYEKMKSKEFSHPDYDLNFDVLADVRQGTFELKTGTPDEKMARVTEFLKTNEDKIGKRKCAFLAVNPDQVVNSIFYSEYVKILPIQVKSFSTINAALEWLRIKSSKELLAELI